MADTVLRCKPDRLARSARDIGLWRRMKLSAMRRLIWRAVSLVHPEIGEIDFAHSFPADLDRRGREQLFCWRHERYWRHAQFVNLSALFSKIRGSN
jgi:hypothetical protein